MHELVPRPLLDAVAGGADSWRSVGPVLSVDLVGFTSMAWTLAANGDRGAEAKLQSVIKAYKTLKKAGLAA